MLGMNPPVCVHYAGDPTQVIFVADSLSEIFGTARDDQREACGTVSHDL